MERNLLFISKYREFKEEFLDALRGNDIVIDTAENGIEAATLLKKKEYQVVVTGLVIDGYNGEQLITYINKTCPNTVCIIATKAISAAQLHFFVNKRDVFRVFLRPLNYETEFMDALEEAYEYNGIKRKDEEERIRQDELIATYRASIERISQNLEDQSFLVHKMEDYMKRLASLSLKEYASDIPGESQKRLNSFELGIVEVCCKGGSNLEANMNKAEQAVLHINDIAKM